jgi:c-di-GMP phosphodiesterase
MRDGQRPTFSRPTCSGPASSEKIPPSRSPVIKDIFIGRQGIFDGNMGIFGYELLYRSSTNNSAGNFNGDHATSLVVVNTFMEMGLDQVVGAHLAFINLTRNFLTGELPLPFPKDKVILEVLEDITIDAELVEGIRALAQQGYTIALDDCVYSECLVKLLEFAHIVKIDIQALGMDKVREHVEKFRRHPVKLIAEKIETQQEFDLCRDLGFDYYQGYFLCLPRVLTGQSIPDNKLSILRLLSQLQDPNTPPSELEKIISQDLSLSYKLMRYINSAFFALPRKVESIQQALVYIGNRAIKTWVTLLVMRGIEDKPSALTNTALARARMCEQLAIKNNARDPETYFTVGLFSVVDAMMDVPMERVLNALPFTDDVRSALLLHQGPLGAALSCTIAYERGDWNRVAFGGLVADVVASVYLDSIAWADEISGSLR